VGRTVKIVADTGVCIGAGLCALLVPSVFDQDAVDGTVVLLREQPGEGERAGVLEAVDACPSGALSVHTEQDP
jgi:ferredoxin